MRKGSKALHVFNDIFGAFTCHLPAILTTGRTKELPLELKKEFIRFAKSIGLTEDHIIFPVPIGNHWLS